MYKFNNCQTIIFIYKCILRTKSQQLISLEDREFLHVDIIIKQQFIKQSCLQAHYAQQVTVHAIDDKEVKIGKFSLLTHLIVF